MQRQHARVFKKSQADTDRIARLGARHSATQDAAEQMSVDNVHEAWVTLQVKFELPCFVKLVYNPSDTKHDAWHSQSQQLTMSRGSWCA